MLHRPAVAAALPGRGFGSKLAAYVVVVLISIVSLFPLYWMLENSLRTAVDAGANVTLVPEVPVAVVQLLDHVELPAVPHEHAS